MSFIRSSKAVQSIAFPSLGRNRPIAPGGLGAVQTVGHHTPVLPWYWCKDVESTQLLLMLSEGCREQSVLLVSLLSTTLRQRGVEQLAVIARLYRLCGWTSASLVWEAAKEGSLVLVGWPCFGSRTESWRPQCPDFQLSSTKIWQKDTYRAFSDILIASKCNTCNICKHSKVSIFQKTYPHSS